MISIFLSKPQIRKFSKF